MLLHSDQENKVFKISHLHASGNCCNIMKATIAKHIFSLIAVVFSIIWLFYFGGDFIFSNNSSPYMKIIAIIVGYIIPITNLYYDYGKIKNKIVIHTHRRELRIKRNILIELNKFKQ